MFQDCFRTSRSCFGISSRYLGVLWFFFRRKKIIISISAECEVKDSKRAGTGFKVEFGCPDVASGSPEVASELVRDIFEIWCILIFIYYSGWKYWLQKYFTENIEAIWASSFKIWAKIEMLSVELTVHKESVVVEEIKEVELWSRCALFYDRNYNRIKLQPRGHAPSKLPVKKWRRLLHKRRKVMVFVGKSMRENIISYYSSVFTINLQPQRRSVRSHRVSSFF